MNWIDIDLNALPFDEICLAINSDGNYLFGYIDTDNRFNEVVVCNGIERESGVILYHVVKYIPLSVLRMEAFK